MKTTKYFNFYEKTIIENIDFESYDLKNDVSLYDKIKTMYNIFKMEYLNEYNLNSYGSEINVFKEYLQGLPNCLTVPFYNFDILNNATKEGFKLDTEEKENDFLDSYFLELSKAFFTLKDNL